MYDPRYPQWPFYTPPPYYPPPVTPPTTPKAQKKLAKMAKQTLVQRLVDLDKEREDIERYLKSKEPKKDDKKPEGLFNRTFSFSETLLLVIVLALPITLFINRLAAISLKLLQ